MPHPRSGRRRRAADPAHAGGADVAHVAEGMAARDKSDSSRSISPLMKAADAVYIDTTGMPVEDVVAQVVGLVRDKAGARDWDSGLRTDAVDRRTRNGWSRASGAGLAFPSPGPEPEPA